MIKEKSCGAVIYKIDNHKLQYLIIRGQAGHHYTFPKGHMEKGETEFDTATREIKEETNLDVKMDTNFRKVITYSPSDNVIKDVVFFVAEALNPKDIKMQKEEVEEIFWTKYSDSLKIISFDNQKELIKEANDYLLKHIKG